MRASEVIVLNPPNPRIIMKFLIRLLCLASLVAGLNLSAQTPPESDDFTTPMLWNSISNPPQIPKGGGTTVFGSDVLYYVVTSPSADDAAGRSWSPRVGPADSNWHVEVYVNFADVSLTNVGQYANLNLGVAFSNHSMTVAIDQYLTVVDVTPTLVRGFETYVDSGMTPLDTDTASGLTQGTLRLEYVAGALTAYFSSPGYNSGALQEVGTITNVTSSWGMTASDTFNIFLVGSSGTKVGESGPTIDSGQAYFDNFASSGLEARTAPVPEPSTYAAIIGLLALGFAIYRRRG